MTTSSDVDRQPLDLAAIDIPDDTDGQDAADKDQAAKADANGGKSDPPAGVSAARLVVLCLVPLVLVGAVVVWMFSPMLAVIVLVAGVLMAGLASAAVHGWSGRQSRRRSGGESGSVWGWQSGRSGSRRSTSRRSGSGGGGGGGRSDRSGGRLSRWWSGRRTGRGGSGSASRTAGSGGGRSGGSRSGGGGSGQRRGGSWFGRSGGAGGGSHGRQSGRSGSGSHGSESWWPKGWTQSKWAPWNWWPDKDTDKSNDKDKDSKSKRDGSGDDELDEARRDRKDKKKSKKKDKDTAAAGVPKVSDKELEDYDDMGFLTGAAAARLWPSIPQSAARSIPVSTRAPQEGSSRPTYDDADLSYLVDDAGFPTTNRRSTPMADIELSTPFAHMIDASTPQSLVRTLTEAADASRVVANECEQKANDLDRDAQAHVTSPKPAMRLAGEGFAREAAALRADVTKYRESAAAYSYRAANVK